MRLENSIKLDRTGQRCKTASLGGFSGRAVRSVPATPRLSFAPMGKVPKHIDVRETRRREQNRCSEKHELLRNIIAVCTLALELVDLFFKFL